MISDAARAVSGRLKRSVVPFRLADSGVGDPAKRAFASRNVPIVWLAGTLNSTSPVLSRSRSASVICCLTCSRWAIGSAATSKR